MSANSDKDIPVNIYRPANPFTATCISNEVLVRPGAAGDTRHVKLFREAIFAT
jgi:ferredoxin--NADP+ reductase